MATVTVGYGGVYMKQGGLCVCVSKTVCGFLGNARVSNKKMLAPKRQWVQSRAALAATALWLP